ncbi:hypothetical protein GCK72_026238 [Caenorhabditis remanei]|uniref:Uncharacterized protein n=1 Tax=Caenorhabditis remanei TaxID=31234 RepID=A0A6A5G5J7_CAERE|nr:hypothetical protein GCK72_026238 [Caenorhabditis remanei]KAF1749769.1 hypothetical protein GCK72_026238 [Caenorhabditis remanei]
MSSSKGTRPNRNFIPVKHRPAGLVSQEDDSYRSRSTPRIGNKPSYKHENNHANGVDDSPLGQVLDFKLKTSNRCVTSINERKSASNYCSTLDNSNNQNFPTNYSIISMSYYQEDKRLNGNGSGDKGRDNQRGNRNSSSRSAVGVGNKTFNGYDKHHDKSLLNYDDSDDVFVDKVTLDASVGKNKSSEGPNFEDARTKRARSCSRRSCTNKSFAALDGCYNKDYIPVTHRPARKADDLFCTRPTVPRGGVRVALNQTLTGIEDGSSQANMFTKRGTRNGDFIPLKHRPARLSSQENDSYRSRSHPRIGNKPFYKHENNHANGVDDSLLGQVSDFKLKSSDRCVTSTNELKTAACIVPMQPNLFIMKDAVVSQKSGHYKQEVSGDGRVTSIVNSEKVTNDGTVECVNSRLKQLITEHIQAQNQEDAKVNNPTAHKHIQILPGVERWFWELTGTNNFQKPSNNIVPYSDNGSGSGDLTDGVKTTDRDFVVRKCQEESLPKLQGQWNLVEMPSNIPAYRKTNGDLNKTFSGFDSTRVEDLYLEDELNETIRNDENDDTLEIANGNTANIVWSDQWTHFMKMKEFASDVFPSSGIAGVYTCWAGGVPEMPYIVVAKDFIMFYGKTEAPQRMPPYFQFELLPLVKSSDDRIVPGVYHYVSVDHEIWPSLMSLGDHLNNACHSADIIYYNDDNLNKVSTSSVSCSSKKQKGFSHDFSN